LLPFLKPISQGDVVVFKFPGERDEFPGVGDIDFVKRCAAVAGDTIEIREGDVYVNGRYAAFNVNRHRPEFASGFPDPRLFPKGSSNNLDFYGPMIVPKSGDQIRLTASNYPLWSKLVQEEGRAITKTSDGLISIDGKEATSYTIARNYVFVLGDNFYNSDDSRFWGFLPEDNVIGTASVIYWSNAEPANGESTHLTSSIRWDRIGRIVH
ncbi:MAG TPA: signal peptidase I, partial [Bacteroidota bacterium]|nr:signal peptidase I [Bacteroidota bacterium]